MPDEPQQLPNSEPSGEMEGLRSDEELRGVVAELRAQLEASNAEQAHRATELAAREAALAQVAEAASQAEARVAELATRNGELQEAALAAHRRALLAEHAGQVVPELVQGATLEDLDAGVATAREAYGRIAEQVRATGAAAVSTGAFPRSEPNAEDISPLQKITGALSRNGR